MTKMSNKKWSRKGYCPDCGVATSSRHKDECIWNYKELDDKGRYNNHHHG